MNARPERTQGIGAGRDTGRTRHAGALLQAGFLACAGLGVLLLESWHGPTILSLWGSHGVDAGDLPAIPLAALALAIAVRRRPDRGSLAPALALAALLIVAGIVAEDTGGPLVPDGGGTFGGSTARTSAHNPEPVERWSHVALSYDGHRLRLYVNGNEVASRSTKGTIEHTDDPLWIGGSQPYGEFFRGLIDEVRIEDRALSTSEIRREMTRPIARSRAEEGLVGAYSFDTRSRTRAADSSPAGNDGAIEGPVWTSEGKFGGALSFDADHELVRIPASTSLNLATGMTLSAWIHPSSRQAGWRTILHRQTDTYFLMAGSPRENDAGPLDDAPALLLGGVILLCTMLAVDGGRWLTNPASRLWPCITLFLAGSVGDAVLAPARTLIGPLLVAIWLALTAASRRAATAFWLAAAAFCAVTIVSLPGRSSIEAGATPGASARALALAIVLALVGIEAGLARAQGAATATR